MTEAFHLSPTNHEVDGTPVNRQFARMHASITRKQNKRKYVPDTHGESKARGLQKIQKFHRRANLMLLPLNDEEQREELIAFQDEFNENDGVLSVDSYIQLNNMTDGQAERITELWGLMIDHEVNMDGIDDHPDLQPQEEPIDT